MFGWGSESEKAGIVRGWQGALSTTAEVSRVIMVKYGAPNPRYQHPLLHLLKLSGNRAEGLAFRD